MNKGIIIKINKNLYTVSSDTEVFDCKESGKLLYRRVLPTVGDYVLFDKESLRINELLPRKNSLIRPLISNIDKLFIITSVKKPNFSSYLLDKLLLIALSNNIEPIIIFTKEDILSFKEKLEINKYKKYYKSLGYKVFKNTQISKIKKEFKNSIIALTGQTGAGKSTLLNKLNKNLKLETNEISEALGRGKHTTRLVTLYNLFGGLIADTPGFSSLDLNLKEEDIKKYSKEFNINCKYKTCKHINEEGCNVIPKLHKNKIYDERYNNYIKLISEVRK